MPDKNASRQSPAREHGMSTPDSRTTPSLRSFPHGLPSPASSSKTATPPAPNHTHPPHPPHPLPPPLSASNGSYDPDEPTPTRAVFDLGQGDRDDDDEELDDFDMEDNDEFNSHYSRQSSPATSSDSEFEQDVSSVADLIGDEDTTVPVHRVNSLPGSAVSHNPLHASLHMSRSTTALARGPPPLPPPLFPPFYNKPPTPLPPSPSLTSLLRPPSLMNRSATSTRATSPDSSDVETPNDTEAQVVQQARRANPLPPTAPKVPTYEYYGFVLYLGSSLAFLIYLLWAYLPSPFLHALGITYYPDRWWALAIPAWIVILLIYIYVALACYNIEYLTLGLSRLETMVDDAGSVAILDENGRIRKGGSKRYVEDLEERRRREATWNKKKGGQGSGRTKKKKERERDKEDDWSGYAGGVIDGGVASGLSWRQIWNEGTDGVMDVPLGGVCEVLYGENSNVL